MKRNTFLILLLCGLSCLALTTEAQARDSDYTQYSYGRYVDSSNRAYGSKNDDDYYEHKRDAGNWINEYERSRQQDRRQEENRQYNEQWNSPTNNGGGY